jgi:hypothetical protein
MNTHGSNNKRVVVQEAGLLADFGRKVHPCGIDGENPRAEKRDLLNGLPKPFQCLDLGRMVAKPQGDAGRLPTERLHRLKRHQAMGDLAENVRGGDAVNLLIFDAFEESRSGRPEKAVWLEMGMNTVASTKTVAPAGKSA